jgi:hypothetical protein
VITEEIPAEVRPTIKASKFLFKKIDFMEIYFMEVYFMEFLFFLKFHLSLVFVLVNNTSASGEITERGSTKIKKNKCSNTGSFKIIMNSYCGVDKVV